MKTPNLLFFKRLPLFTALAVPEQLFVAVLIGEGDEIGAEFFAHCRLPPDWYSLPSYHTRFLRKKQGAARSFAVRRFAPLKYGFLAFLPLFPRKIGVKVLFFGKTELFSS